MGGSRNEQFLGIGNFLISFNLCYFGRTSCKTSAQQTANMEWTGAANFCNSSSGCPIIFRAFSLSVYSTTLLSFGVWLDVANSPFCCTLLLLVATEGRPSDVLQNLTRRLNMFEYKNLISLYEILTV